jgi:hypothetical protein
MVRNMSGKPCQGEKQTRTRALTGSDFLASKDHSYQTLDGAHARACGLATEGNCACATVRLVSHVRRGVLAALVPIATLALELTLSTCGGEYL